MSERIEGLVERKCVLVVEDEPIIAMYLESVVTEGGFEVLGPATSVDDALDLLHDRRPDAAVLDLTLGSEKVTPVALLLKSLKVPFVLATTTDASELDRYAILRGVRNLGKPTDPQLLLDALHAI